MHNRAIIVCHTTSQESWLRHNSFTGTCDAIFVHAAIGCQRACLVPSSVQTPTRARRKMETPSTHVNLRKSSTVTSKHFQEKTHHAGGSRGSEGLPL